MLAPKLHFLPSLCSPLEKLWQLPPFPSSPQFLLLAASSPPSLCFLCRNQIPHCPNCCCPFPCNAGGALALSPFPAMGLHIYALPSLISISFVCFQVLLPFVGRVLCVSDPGISPCLCVLPMLTPVSFPRSCAADCLCHVTPACKPGPAAAEKK